MSASKGWVSRAKLERAHGDIDQSIRTSRATLDERIALSGRNSRETAVLYNSLAISLTSANRLDEALAAVSRDHRYLPQDRHGRCTRHADHSGQCGHVGGCVQGRFRRPREQLRSAIEHERELAGNSAGSGRPAMSYYGRALWILNRTPWRCWAKQPALAARYAGATSPVSLQNRLFLAMLN